MKIFRLSLLLVFLSIPLIATDTYIPSVSVQITDHESSHVHEYTVDSMKLINALIMVESSSNDSAFCLKENAAGCLQIRPVMVNEVNRILHLKGSNVSYDLNDRWKRDKSIEMFWVFSEFYTKEWNQEFISRRWNGGPKGHKKSSTLSYWSKVKRQL